MPALLVKRCCAAALALGLAAAALGQPRAAGEAELKAAFAYRIALFVEWPAESLPAGAPFQICSAGNDAAWTAAFATLDGKKVQGRPLAPLRAVLRDDELRGCQLLFVPQREGRKAPPAAAGLLSIGESEGFAAAGGVVGFVREGTQLRFDINRDAAARAQLRLSAELLKVARGVIDGAGARP